MEMSTPAVLTGLRALSVAIASSRQMLKQVQHDPLREGGWMEIP
jgi:hypothetical protein